MSIRSRAGLSFASVALLVACADQPTAPAAGSSLLNSPSFAVTGGPDITTPRTFEGQLWVCNDGGTYTGVDGSFDWTLVTVGGAAVSNGTATIASGDCELVVAVDTDVSGRFKATVTENAPLPADWTFDSIVLDFSKNSSANIGPAVIDLPTRTISNVSITNDGGAVMTFFNIFEPPGPSCTLTQGFWKTHQELWDAPGEMVVWNGQTFFASGLTYAQIYAISAAGGNSYTKLAHQYMAAKLNLNGGSDPAINASIAQAESLFAGHTASSHYIKSGTWNGVATALDNYNNGVTGPGHCGS